MAKVLKGGNAGALFEYIKEKYRLKDEAELAEFIQTQRSIISEIRNENRVVNEVMLVRICDITGMSLKKVRQLIAMT